MSSVLGTPVLAAAETLLLTTSSSQRPSFGTAARTRGAEETLLSPRSSHCLSIKPCLDFFFKSFSHRSSVQTDTHRRIKKRRHRFRDKVSLLNSADATPPSLHGEEEAEQERKSLSGPKMRLHLIPSACQFHQTETVEALGQY